MEASGLFYTDYGREAGIVRTRMQWGILALLIVLLLGLAQLLSTTGSIAWLVRCNVIMLTIIAVLGLNVTTGMAGQISMGQAAFVMIGGYAAGILGSTAGWPFWLAVPVGSLITGAVGVLVGLPSLRLKGFYLAVATFAFAFLARYIVLRTGSLTGGSFGLTGVPSPSIGGFAIESDVSWFYFLMMLTIIAVIFSAKLARSRFGRAFHAIRESEITAAGQGIDVYPTKLRAFFVGTLLAGVSGGLWAHYMGVIGPDQFSFWDSIWFLGMIFVGGAGSTMGAVMGVIFLQLIAQGTATLSQNMGGWFPSLGTALTANLTHLVYGLVIIVFLSFLPNGLVSGWNRFKAGYRLWPFAN